MFKTIPDGWLANWTQAGDAAVWCYRKIAATAEFRSWVDRAPIVTGALSNKEAALLSERAESFLEETPFPALEGWQMESAGALGPAPGVCISRTGVLRVVEPFSNEGEDAEACRLFLEICADKGIDVERVSEVEWETSGDAILFGRVTTNRAIGELAKRSLWGHPDETLPAPGEFYISFRNHPLRLGSYGMIAAAGEGKGAALAGALFEKLELSDGEIYIPYLHEIARSEEASVSDDRWEKLLNRWQEMNRHGLPPFPVGAEPEALASHFALGLNPGEKGEDFYNALFVTWVCEASRFYSLHGDPRALRFLRAGMAEICHYFLGSNEATSCLADFHFHLGPLVAEYARWEMLPLFSTGERRFFRASLLSMVRIVYRYYTAYYFERLAHLPGHRAELLGMARHNHQTFACRSLALAACYFERYAIDDCRGWKAAAGVIFDPAFFARIKQRENANIYEWLPYDHAAAYSLLMWGDLRLFAKGVLEEVALRQRMTLDSTLKVVDYGDADVHFTQQGVLALSRVLAGTGGDPSGVPFLRVSDAQLQGSIESVIWSLNGFRYARNEDSPGGLESLPKEGDGWAMARLEPVVALEHLPLERRASAFDKAVFRSGWGQDALYVLMEGFGNAHFSHAHHSVQALERFTQDGRIWLTSNGYGKPVGETRSNLAFFNRQLGPTEHNMLVFAGEGEVPPMASQLRGRTHSERLHGLCLSVEPYRGTRWDRSIAVIDEAVLVVIDEVSDPDFQKGSAGKEAWLEWNLLGDLTPLMPHRWTASQSGLALSMRFLGCGEIARIPRPNGDWGAALKKGGYPFWCGGPEALKLPLDWNTEGRARIVSLFSTRGCVDFAEAEDGGLVRVRNGISERLDLLPDGEFRLRTV